MATSSREHLEHVQILKAENGPTVYKGSSSPAFLEAMPAFLKLLLFLQWAIPMVASIRAGLEEMKKQNISLYETGRGHGH